MNEPLKIKVTVGGRVYPINVKNEIEEEGMRRAADKINELVTKFEENYSVSDKQDVLAMCALQFAALSEIRKIASDKEKNEALEKLNKLHGLLNNHI